MKKIARKEGGDRGTIICGLGRSETGLKLMPALEKVSGKIVQVACQEPRRKKSQWDRETVPRQPEGGRSPITPRKGAGERRKRSMHILLTGKLGSVTGRILVVYRK